MSESKIQQHMSAVFAESPTVYVLLSKEYSDENLVQVTEDVEDACFNTDAIPIPTDEYGFRKGHFHIAVIWEPDNEG